jgi:c-di-GMP-binding flagellar brake protein YcgR
LGQSDDSKLTARATRLTIDALCVVGTAMSVEWKGKKYNSAFRGGKIPPDAETAKTSNPDTYFILLDIPVFGGKPVIPEFNTPITVRFLYEGTIFGFNSFLRQVHGKGSLMVLDYPPRLETHTLRNIERIKTLMRAEVLSPNIPAKASGVILDFSWSGAKLGLETDAVFENGQVLSISFTLGDGTAITNLESTVRNSRKSGDKTVYGISFNEASKPSIEILHNFYQVCFS